MTGAVDGHRPVLIELLLEVSEPAGDVLHLWAALHAEQMADELAAHGILADVVRVTVGDGPTC